MSNSITLEKRIEQNLICNRWSHQVPIQWYKVNLLDISYLSPSKLSMKMFQCIIQGGNRYSVPVDETETSSILQLKGKAKEVGTYECRWKNSRGEPRHRNFTVRVNFVDQEVDDDDETNTIILPATLTGLLIVGMGFGVKFYIDKVRENLISSLHAAPRN